MGGVGPAAAASPGPTTPVATDRTGLTTEFAANSPQKMPVYNSPSVTEAAKRKREEIAARSGRTSTNLTGNPGTRTYQSSFLGSVT